MATIPILAQQSPSPLSKDEAQAAIESCLKENNLEVTQKDQPLTETNQKVVVECLRKKGIVVHKHSQNH